MISNDNPIFVWMCENKLTTRAAADLLQTSVTTVHSLLHGHCSKISNEIGFNFLKFGYTIEQIVEMQDKYKKLRAENIENQISVLRQKKGLQ